jgi:hypothetical protein
MLKRFRNKKKIIIMRYFKYEVEGWTAENKGGLDGENGEFPISAIIELGPISVDGVDKFAVDILWENEPNPNLTPFIVWPLPENVKHTILGLEDLYLKEYELANPPI